jgi:hypothetical protein
VGSPNTTEDAAEHRCFGKKDSIMDGREDKMEDSVVDSLGRTRGREEKRPKERPNVVFFGTVINKVGKCVNLRVVANFTSVMENKQRSNVI